ncbi:hypothetical protein Y025_2071 [Burkholderia pseudomallei TSV32]|nr:hypothetical protein Y025_2071 [Burkholderia pseudomallei TSV32]
MSRNCSTWPSRRRATARDDAHSRARSFVGMLAPEAYGPNGILRKLRSACARLGGVAGARRVFEPGDEEYASACYGRSLQYESWKFCMTKRLSAGLRRIASQSDGIDRPLI